MTDLYDDLLKPRETAPVAVLGGARTITDAQLRQAERQKTEQEPGLWEGIKAATRLESTGIAAYGILTESAFDPDPDFVFPATESEQFQAVTRDLPPELWPNLARAQSAEHLQFLRERMLQEVQAAKDLAEMGGTGTALRIGRAALDEGAIALTVATGGLAAPFIYGAKVSRLARFGRLGALAAAENTALDALLLRSQETKDASDLLYSALGGFAVGGAIGVLTRGEQRELGRSIKNAADAHDLQTLNDAGITSIGKPPRSKIADAIQEIYGERLGRSVDAEPGAAPEALRSVGAAQAAPETLIRPLRDEQAPPEVLNTPKLSPGESAIRFDMAAGFGSSENPWTRFLGGRLVADPVGYRGVVNEISAEETANFLRQRAAAEFAKDANIALSDWLSANRVPLGQRTGMTARFFEAVTAAVRAQDFSDPHIGRAAQAWARSVRNVAEEAKRAGVKGFEDLDLRADYVPRMFSQEKLARLVEQHGSGQIERLIAKAVERATDIAADYAAKIARGYLHRVRKVQAGLESAPQFALRDKDLLAQSMRDAGVSDKEIGEVLGALDFGSDTTKAGKIARAKRRLSMDEETVMELKGRDGVVRAVHVTDLFENDARLLLHNYARQLAGHTALAKTLGITSKADWDAVIRKAIAYAGDNLNMSKTAIETDLKRLEFAYKAITGQPVEEFTNLHKAARVVRDLNFMRTLNQAGFAQAADLGNVISFGGWRTVLTHMPALRGMIQRVRDTGELADDLAAELEAIVPLGTDGLRHATPSRFDSGFTDELEPVLESAAGKKVDIALRAMRKATGYVSGLTPLTIIQQRMAAKAIAQNFINTAFQSGGKKVNLNRLKAMGLSEEMSERVFAQIRGHAVTEKGALTGRKLKSLDFDRWDDLDARDAFAMALYRQGRRLVQENDLGSSAMWMHKEVGRVLIQFRSFMLNAYSKQLLHNFKIDGWAAFVPWAYGMVFGGLAYTLRQHANTVGLDDRQKLLRERLKPERVAAAAFNTAAMSSLVPAGIDTIWQFTGNEPVFQHARTTGLGTSLLDWRANPTTQTLGTLLNTPGTLQDGLTRGEARQMLSLLPYQNALGIKNVLDILVEDLPQRTRRD